MNKINAIIILGFSFSYSFSQNVYDAEHLLKFADHLYNNQEYFLAINEYKHAAFLGSCNSNCQFKLFNSYLKSKQFQSGVLTFKSFYPEGFACNDTLDLIYSKLLIKNTNYDEAENLSMVSKNLSSEQRLFITVSADLFANRWENASQESQCVSNENILNPYKDVIREIESLNYKNPYLSMFLSAVVPGSGKMYSGYWRDGFMTIAVVGLTAWQAYRGFTLYGIDQPYTWIFTTLSASFYISNLYGSFKAANMKNHNLRTNVRNTIETIFDSSYSY